MILFAICTGRLLKFLIIYYLCSLQVAPALYTHKVAHKKAIEKQQERIANMQLKLQTDYKIDFTDVSSQKTETEEDSVQKKKSIFGIFCGGLTNFQKFVHRNLNLIQLLTPMLLQDGPFLIVRLVLVSYYKVTGIYAFHDDNRKNSLVDLKVRLGLGIKSEYETRRHDIFNQAQILEYYIGTMPQERPTETIRKVDPPSA